MKKLFISCPMKGRTSEAIAKSKEDMHRLAEIYFGEPLECINSTFTYRPPENVNESIWYLGESIKVMADADYFIGICYEEFFSGCMIETDVARKYGISSVTVQLNQLQSLSDCIDIINKEWSRMEKIDR